MRRSGYYDYSETDVTDDSGNITKYAFKDNYAWNTDLGKLASTTGNIYGIYDISGGAIEYTAACLNNGCTALTSIGVSVWELRNKQIYSSTVSDGSSAQVADYELSKDTYGDAVYETSIGYTDYPSWCYDFADFPYGSWPFFCRGNNFDDIIGAGAFCFHLNNGGYLYSIGFRGVASVSGGTPIQQEF